MRSPYDDVKVADIAALADLTPAAVHYHFDGKEQILLEAMRKFSEGLLARAEELVDAKVDIATLMGGILTLLRSRRTAATVFFVSSAGLSLSFEAHRKLVRADMAELMIRAGKNDGKRRSKAESAVIGAALVSVLEVSATSMLRGDEGASTLGSRKLIETVGALASRVLG